MNISELIEMAKSGKVEKELDNLEMIVILATEYNKIKSNPIPDKYLQDGLTFVRETKLAFAGFKAGGMSLANIAGILLKK